MATGLYHLTQTGKGIARNPNLPEGDGTEVIRKLDFYDYAMPEQLVNESRGLDYEKVMVVLRRLQRTEPPVVEKG